MYSNNTRLNSHETVPLMETTSKLPPKWIGPIQYHIEPDLVDHAPVQSSYVFDKVTCKPSIHTYFSKKFVDLIALEIEGNSKLGAGGIWQNI